MSCSKEIKICKQCGDAFNVLYGRPDQSFCSNKCYLLNRWGDKTKLNICPICGKVANSTGKRTQKYCSWYCSQLGKIGRKNPKRSNIISKECSWCGNEIKRPASNFHSNTVFCNYACMAEWQSEFNVQEKHPRWKGGYPTSHGVGWKRARKKAMENANSICQKCKKKPAKHIHHKLPIRYFSKISDAHFSNNLLALCTRCHSIEHKKLAFAFPLLDILNSIK